MCVPAVVTRTAREVPGEEAALCLSLRQPPSRACTCLSGQRRPVAVESRALALLSQLEGICPVADREMTPAKGTTRVCVTCLVQTRVPGKVPSALVAHARGRSGSSE